MTMKQGIFFILLSLLLIACGSQQPVATAVATQPPPSSPTVIPQLEPTDSMIETETADLPPISRSVTAPPHGSVLVDNNGPALSDLSEGWTKVEPGGDTRCALDTDYAYWVKPGTVNKLLLYFEGGGGCWDAATCAANSSFYDPDVGEDEDPSRRSGVFDLDNPANPFHDYHAVFIPSCTGDVHWATRAKNSPKMMAAHS